jgi:hypothetical protein
MLRTRSSVAGGQQVGQHHAVELALDDHRLGGALEGVGVVEVDRVADGGVVAAEDVLASELDDPAVLDVRDEDAVAVVLVVAVLAVRRGCRRRPCPCG